MSKVTGVSPNVECNLNPVRKRKGRSVAALAKLRVDVFDKTHGGGPFLGYDVAYVDGSHYARDVMSDACAAWNMLKRGGVMIFKDYGWDLVMRHLPATSCPRIAVDAFVDLFEDELLVLERGYTCVVQKIANRK